jgi:hypothetical protein
MPKPKQPGKRELKRITKAKTISLFEASGDFVVDEKMAGSVTYHTVKWADDDQVIAAIYGSLQHCASIWMKENAFGRVKSLLPEDAHVEDVAPFRRGFQWAVHIKHPDSPLVPLIVDACISAGAERLEKTKSRREADERRAVARAEREKRRAETRRDWREVDVPLEDASLNK